jgi:hypothetical protein
MPTPRTDDTIHHYEWLLSANGEALMAEVRRRLDAGEPLLRVSEVVRREHDPALAALAITQVELRAQARAKFADADRLVFTREGLEQATSDRIAAHRASRYEPFGRIIDLCSGIGGDLMALAALPGTRSLVAVDLDPVHLLLAEHNVRTTSPNAELALIRDDVRNAPIGTDDAVFIDPARRDTRGRMGGIASEPPLEWAIGLAERAAGVGIKTAPGIPHERVPGDWEMETIALGNDLKEAVLWSPALASSHRSATVIDDHGTHLLRSVAGDPVSIIEPLAGAWLFDPNPAVTRAGLVEDLARSLGASKIDDEIGFLVADQPEASPFARALPIIDAMPWHEKRLKKRLQELGAGPIDVRRRGLAGDVAAITKRLRGKGDRRLVVAMTRYRDEPWAIICDIPDSQG